jgi:hypothetical protein
VHYTRREGAAFAQRSPRRALEGSMRVPRINCVKSCDEGGATNETVAAWRRVRARGSRLLLYSTRAGSLACRCIHAEFSYCPVDVAARYGLQHIALRKWRRRPRPPTFVYQQLLTSANTPGSYQQGRFDIFSPSINGLGLGNGNGGTMHCLPARPPTRNPED